MPADDAVPLTIDIFTTARDDVQTIKHASTYLQQVRRSFPFCMFLYQRASLLLRL